MNALKIFNPASGEHIVDVSADDAASVATKVAQARAAQPRWAATPLAERKACMVRFRALLVDRIESLAHTLTSEMGKPIKQARNEISGLPGRIDFFLEKVESATDTETVLNDGGMTERIGHDPLGVIANISAWNYPYFVGGNVFVPALLTGNAVLYKPSEFATLTGWHITRLLHEAGIPNDVFIPVVGTGEVGAALLAQKLDGVFFTGSYATGAKIAATIGPRMIRMQLELGGKDPIYVCEDVDLKVAAESLADGAMYNTGQSCCSVERIYVHERIYDAFVEAFLATVTMARVLGSTLIGKLPATSFGGPILLYQVAGVAAERLQRLIQQGIIAPHFRSTGAGQVFADLIISLILAMIWMAHDAKRLGRNPWPWIALTLAAGSFGPLVYLLMRKPAVMSASAAATRQS